MDGGALFGKQYRLKNIGHRAEKSTFIPSIPFDSSETPNMLLLEEGGYLAFCFTQSSHRTSVQVLSIAMYRELGFIRAVATPNLHGPRLKMGRGAIETSHLSPQQKCFCTLVASPEKA